jgi:hypothetical protein
VTKEPVVRVLAEYLGFSLAGLGIFLIARTFRPGILRLPSFHNRSEKSEVKRGAMSQRFDIFCFQDSALRWLTAVDTLEDAKAHIEKLPESASGSYGVLDQRTGEMLSFQFEHSLAKVIETTQMQQA